VIKELDALAINSVQTQTNDGHCVPLVVNCFTISRLCSFCRGSFRRSLLLSTFLGCYFRWFYCHQYFEVAHLCYKC